MRLVLPRRSISAFLLVGLALFCRPALAATPAESFVSDNIHAGLVILDDKQASAEQRSARFETLLLGATDLKRVAIFTLGSYAAAASQADKDAFVASFQNYAVAVYRSYFQKYTGQTLNVTGSRDHAPGDTIVSTKLADPSGGQPLQIDFRVSTIGAKTVLTDIGISGIWLVPAQRDDFGGFLGQHKGDVAALAKHLDEVARAYRS